MSSRGLSSMGLGFPPFTPAVKRLIIINTVVYLLLLLLGAIAPGLAATLIGLPELITTGVRLPLLPLVPWAVTHGFIWQLVTYGFLHMGVFHILFNMLTLWMFGAQLEMDWGTRKFYEFYFYALVGAALVTVGVSYLGLVSAFSFLNIGPLTTTVGASGAIFGLMIAFAMLYGDMEFMLFPLPFLIKAKYLVAIFVLIDLAYLFQGFGPGHRGESIAYFAHLGGALFGWFYVRYLPRRGLAFATSERYFGLRNSYYRWKRRRAARKFEVYMRNHDRDRSIDHYGEPGSSDDRPQKGDGEPRPPWVN